MTLSSPGPTLGVVGGGQLGRMLAEAAAPLGVEVVVADPTPDPPAAPVARDAIVGAFDDEETLRELAERADVLTYEIELADPEVVETVAEETDTPVHPDPETLRFIRDKLVQKRRFADAGVPVPAFRAASTLGEIEAAAEEFGYPVMLKARQGGYDGRGNASIHDEHGILAALEVVGGPPTMVEEFVDFERELAVIGCVGDGEREVFPVTETIHEDEILRETVSPARADPEVRERAREVAHDVLDVVEGRGVYGIELFETEDGEVLLNEVAPRPHNSGHWTIEGCHTGQFEQHVRATTGRPLGDAGRRAPTALTNLLGDVGPEERGPATMHGEEAIMAADRAHLHWYGKRESYLLRKMGHVTVAGGAETVEDPLERARELREGVSFEVEDGDED